MEQYMVFVWLAVIVAAVVVEALTSDLVSIWFVAGGIAGLIANAFGILPWTQVMIAAVVSLLLLIATRPFVKKKLDFEKTGTNADRYIGETGVVLEDINNMTGSGQVKIRGSIWTARSAVGEAIIPKDSEVKILRIEGVKVLVEPK